MPDNDMNSAADGIGGSGGLVTFYDEENPRPRVKPVDEPLPDDAVEEILRQPTYGQRGG